jgi:hypothetical protein
MGAFYVGVNRSSAADFDQQLQKQRTNLSPNPRYLTHRQGIIAEAELVSLFKLIINVV